MHEPVESDSLSASDELAWVNKNLANVIERAFAAPQDEKARVSCNHDAHFLGHLEAGATDEWLASDEVQNQ